MRVLRKIIMRVVSREFHRRGRNYKREDQGMLALGGEVRERQSWEEDRVLSVGGFVGS